MGEASLHNFDEENSKDFRWLSREARGKFSDLQTNKTCNLEYYGTKVSFSPLGPTYTSYSHFSHLPACSFDWGAQGYAGSSNFGGELLYLSAPSPRRGLIMARGHFSTSLYTSLSRAQIEFGGPATFGLEISRTEQKYNPDEKDSRGSSFKLGTMIDRGCYNYRWPVNEYHLDKWVKDNEAEEKHVGKCQMFSCAKEGTFYQVLRIEENVPLDAKLDPKPQFPDDSQIVLTIGGPVWFQSFEERGIEHSVGDNKDEVHRVNSEPIPSKIQDSSRTQYDTIRYWNENPEKWIGLEAKVYQLQNGKYEPLRMIESDAIADNGTPDTQEKFRTKAYNILVPLPKPNPKLPGEGRCATFVVSIHLYEGDEKWDDAKRFEPPSSEDIYSHVGVNPSNEKATGVMWENLIIERRNKSESLLDLTEAGLIGRSLEKILQVDSVPATFKGKERDLRDQAAIKKDKDAFPTTPETALVGNLFVRQNVDLKQLL
jgi:hypothetical protein